MALIDPEKLDLGFKLSLSLATGDSISGTFDRFGYSRGMGRGGGCTMHGFGASLSFRPKLMLIYKGDFLSYCLSAFPSF